MISSILIKRVFFYLSISFIILKDRGNNMIGRYNTKEKKYLLLYNIISFAFLFLLFILRNTQYIRPITLSITIILLFIFILLFGFRKDHNNSLKIHNILQFSIVLLIYLIIIYTLGVKVDYIKHVYSFSKIEEIIYMLGSIIIIEILRYTIYSKNINDTKQHLISVIFFSLIEILIVNNYCYLDNIINISIISLEKNILLTTNSKNGYRANILYALLLELLPNSLTYPNLTSYLYAIILTVINSMLFILVLKPNRKKEMETTNHFKKGFLISVEVTLAITVIVTITLVSGLFTYSLSSIASNSMYPTLQKGDAIIIKRLSDNEKNKLRKGDIIVFNEDNHVITHRIVQVKEGVYITKGDNNSTKDLSKKTKNDIVGKVELRIPYLGYPSVFISELLS